MDALDFVTEIDMHGKPESVVIIILNDKEYVPVTIIGDEGKLFIYVEEPTR